MKFILVFAIFAIVSVESHDVYCCNNTQVLLHTEGECFDSNTNRTSEINIGTCEEFAQYPISVINFTITDAGKLLIIMDGAEPELEPGTFCVANGTTNSTERQVMLCVDVEEEILDESVLAYCMLVSVVFMAFTALVYSILPEIRDLQGKSIINFCISSAVGLLILSIMKIMSYQDMKWCAVRGFLTYFFILASFFWTNSIAIQILLNIRRPTVSDYGWKQFIWYVLYSWGIPAILTIIMAIINFIPGHHKRPGIGLNTCWFFDHKQQWYYMYSVMTILIALNICIFIYIFIQLWRNSFSSTHIKAVKYRFGMTVRMVIVMGLPWIFEMIGSMSEPHIIWVALDVFNTLQGPLIFFVLVVMRRRVLKALYKRGMLFCLSGMVEKHLALVDDEEDVIQHTMDVGLDEKLTTVPS